MTCHRNTNTIVYNDRERPEMFSLNLKGGVLSSSSQLPSLLAPFPGPLSLLECSLNNSRCNTRTSGGGRGHLSAVFQVCRTGQWLGRAAGGLFRLPVYTTPRPRLPFLPHCRSVIPRSGENRSLGTPLPPSPPYFVISILQTCPSSLPFLLRTQDCGTQAWVFRLVSFNKEGN